MREIADVAAIGNERAVSAQIRDAVLVEFVGDLAAKVALFGVLIADFDVAVRLRFEDPDRVVKRSCIALEIGVHVVEGRVTIAFKER